MYFSAIIAFEGNVVVGFNWKGLRRRLNFFLTFESLFSETGMLSSHFCERGRTISFGVLCFGKTLYSIVNCKSFPSALQCASALSNFSYLRTKCQPTFRKDINIRLPQLLSFIFWDCYENVTKFYGCFVFLSPLQRLFWDRAGWFSASAWPPPSPFYKTLPHLSSLLNANPTNQKMDSKSSSYCHYILSFSVVLNNC